MIEQEYIDQFVREWLENETNYALFKSNPIWKTWSEIRQDAFADFGEDISDKLLDELIVLISYRFNRMEAKNE